MAYLSELHPEVYSIKPRPGGLANIVPVKPLKKSTDTTSSRSASIRQSATSSTARSSRKRSVTSSITKSSRRSSFQSIFSSKSTKSSKSTGESLFDQKIFTSTPEKPSRDYRIQQVLFSSPWILQLGEEEDTETDNKFGTTATTDKEITILCIALGTIMLAAAEYDKISKDHLQWTLSYLSCIRDEYGICPPNVRSIINHIKMLDNTLESFLDTDDSEDEGVLDAATEPMALVTIKKSTETSPDTVIEETELDLEPEPEPKPEPEPESEDVLVNREDL